jgi:putative endonuclease
LLGRTGEKQAERFLRRLRYRIVARNYRCPAGELDLIALDHDTVVFVEVKTRADREHGDPQDAVNLAKQRQLVRCARYFLQHTQSEDRTCRFDVVAITLGEDGKPQIEHFPEAFVPEG